MSTLSEFFSLTDSAGIGLGAIGGTRLGNKYSQQGKSRTDLAKSIGLRSLAMGAAHTGIDAYVNKGKNIKKSLGRGLKTAGLYGGVGTASSQLAYRNKYKNQYDTANNPNNIKNTVNNVLGGYNQNRSALMKGSGYTKEQADEYANDVARNYNLSALRGKDPNKGLKEINKKWDRKVRNDKGKQRGKYKV